jgi:hypothetical protein
MKDSRLLPGLAAVAPLVIFGFVYVLAVQPKLALERDAEARAASLRAELTRARSLTPPAPAIHNAAQREFQDLVPVEDRSSEVADALRRLLKNSNVGGAGNVSIETGVVSRPSDALESRIKSFDGPIAYRPLTVTFDARTAQLRQILSGLRAMPTIVELRGVEIAPAPSGTVMRTRLALFVYQRSEGGAQAAAVPAPPPIAPLLAGARPALESVPKATSPVASFEPEPVVHTILFSSEHKVALVDGRIVRAGDRLGSGRVLAIEQNAVVFVTDAGLVKRLVLEQPQIRAKRQ